MKSEICWEVISTPRSDRTSPVEPPVKYLQKSQTESLKPNEPVKSITKSDLMFIKDLDPTEKSKIALMIQQIVRLEQSCTELTNNYETIKLKFEKKSDLCKEAEECMDRLAAENDTMRKELLSKDELLSQYSAKLEKTNELLKMSSSSNKKFQKKLNAKKYDVEVQTEDSSSCSISLQTSLLNTSDTRPTHTKSPVQRTPLQTQDSMTVFLTKLDTICDKLSAIDRNPPTEVLVHNHKTEGALVKADVTSDNVFRALEEDEHGVIEPAKIKDSIILVKENTKKAAGYNSKLFSLIDEMEMGSDTDEETLLCDLFYKV